MKDRHIHVCVNQLCKLTEGGVKELLNGVSIEVDSLYDGEEPNEIELSIALMSAREPVFSSCLVPAPIIRK